MMRKDNKILVSGFFQSSLFVISSSFVYVFMEWLFEITKPSAIYPLSISAKVKILLFSYLVVSLVFLLLLLFIQLVITVSGSKLNPFRKFLLVIPVSLLLTFLVLILFDNFTYTIFRFGIVNSDTVVRFVMGMGVIAVFIFLILKSVDVNLPYQSKKCLLTAAIALLIIAGVTSAFSIQRNNQSNRFAGENILEERPNIIFFSSDGLNAESMSVYGYERDTTPLIKQLAVSSLVSLNSFSNATTSMGTETAMLTSKLPFTTRVLYSPNTLSGLDVYQHLPGLLKNEGYRTISLGVPHHVDANAINFHYAFDDVNCEPNTATLITNQISDYGFEYEIYFLTNMIKRIGERLAHIFFIKEMKSPIAEVYDSTISKLADGKRISCLYDYIQDSVQTGQPLMAHVHLLATHGSKFQISNQVFSEGQEQNENWMTDFYDDAILEFDGIVQDLVEYLQENGIYENTILIIYTDHPSQWVEAKRIPLIIRFPNGEYSGEIAENTQSIDIAPTILDYLDLPQPTWMEGSSLLQSDLDPNRLIYITAPVKTAVNSAGFWSLQENSIFPPFYQFERLAVVQCQNIHMFGLSTESFYSNGKVPGYINPCDSEDLSNQQEIHENVTELLTEAGFVLPDDW
jgi:hypothetical protein